MTTRLPLLAAQVIQMAAGDEVDGASQGIKVP
jgi:hypothetical protein